MDANQFEQWEERAMTAQRLAAQAYARLLDLAERHDSGQAHRVAKFLASTLDGTAFPYDLFELRTFDVPIADDLMACLDALRWGKADLHRLVPEGHERVMRLIADWGIQGRQAT